MAKKIRGDSSQKVAVELSAAQTELRKGDKITARLRVTGLKQLKRPLLLQLQNLTPEVIRLSESALEVIEIGRKDISAAGTFEREILLEGISSGPFTISVSEPALLGVSHLLDGSKKEWKSVHHQCDESQRWQKYGHAVDTTKKWREEHHDDPKSRKWKGDEHEYELSKKWDTQSHDYDSKEGPPPKVGSRKWRGDGHDYDASKKWKRDGHDYDKSRKENGGDQHLYDDTRKWDSDNHKYADSKEWKGDGHAEAPSVSDGNKGKPGYQHLYETSKKWKGEGHAFATSKEWHERKPRHDYDESLHDKGQQ